MKTMNSLIRILHDIIDGTVHSEEIRDGLHKDVTNLGEVGAAVPASSLDPEPAPAATDDAQSAPESESHDG